MKKINYELVSVEIIILPDSDVITTSTPFDGKDEMISTEWYEW